MAKRLSVVLPDEAAKALEALAERHGLTLTEAVKRAIATEAYIQGLVDDDCRILAVEDDGKGAVRELVFVSNRPAARRRRAAAVVQPASGGFDFGSGVRAAPIELGPSSQVTV